MKMPEIPEPAARLADGLPVFSESQMLRFAKQYGRDVLDAAINSYSPDDTATDYINKLIDMKEAL